MCMKYVTTWSIIPEEENKSCNNAGVVLSNNNLSQSNVPQNQVIEKNENAEKIQRTIQKQEFLKVQLEKMGLNINSVKGHARSNSVGGVSSLDQNQIIQMIKKQLIKEDGGVPGSNEIDSNIENALNLIQQNDMSNFGKLEDFLINQMNTQNRELFITMI